jgi:hypothetical protein
MPVRKKKSVKLQAATTWPSDEVSDEEFAHWVETHSLEKLIGTAERLSVKTSSRPVSASTKRRPQAPKDRLTLRISREDLEAARRIAHEKATSCTALLRSWIRERLERERRRAAG